ncbi:MAG: N-acetyltransferase [Dehalococcoidia bacterium]
MPASLNIRPAHESETDRIAEIIFGDPPPESVWMTGSKRRARALGKVMVRLGGEMSWENTTVAEIDGRVVGILQPALGADGGVKVGPALILHTLRIIGPFSIRGVLQRMKVRERLNFALPEGAYHIAELHVDEALRGQGIGGALLDHAEVEARKGGRDQMSLVTAIANPARRLYERHGFVVVETKTDAEYERGTGSEGRVLMVKELSRG